jgi:hypothetical protein
VIRSSEGRRGSGPALDPRAVRRRDTVRARSGAVAGILSTVGFTAIHDLFISDIWNMLPIMAVAGALCGVCIAWSYGLVCEQPSITGWLRYNLVYVTMLGLLGATSVAIFEPITTLAAVIAANEPPTELISTAMPMTIAFALLAAATLSGLYGRRWSHHATILVTVVVVVLFLGLNVSAIGLVDIPTDATSLVAEMLGLILTLALLYAALFIALERQVLRRPDRARDRNATR